MNERERWNEEDGAVGLGIVTVLAMWAATPLAAQELEQGTWTGTISPPDDGDPVAVTYEVGETNGSLSIVMSAPLIQPPMVFSDVKLEGDELTFWWEPCVRVDCALLRREDGSFQGMCTEGTGPAGEGVLTMLPPS